MPETLVAGENATKAMAAEDAVNIQPTAEYIANNCPSIVEQVHDGSPAPLTPQERHDAHTLPFLGALAGVDGQYTFQTFDDNKARKDSSLVRVFHGTFAQHKTKLEALNTKGAGIYVVINQTDGKGRKKVNITDLRGYYVDIDVKDAQEPFDVSKLPLKASMGVKSAGGWHLYFLFDEIVPCDEVKRSEFELDLKRICGSLKKFGADPKCCDCSRVLRLPGFFHCKSNPILVVLEVVNGA